MKRTVTSSRQLRRAGFIQKCPRWRLLLIAEMKSVSFEQIGQWNHFRLTHSSGAIIGPTVCAGRQRFGDFNARCDNIFSVALANGRQCLHWPWRSHYLLLSFNSSGHGRPNPPKQREEDEQNICFPLVWGPAVSYPNSLQSCAYLSGSRKVPPHLNERHSTRQLPTFVFSLF